MSSIRPGFATCSLRLADCYLCAPLWSGDIHAEWMRSLLSRPGRCVMLPSSSLHPGRRLTGTSPSRARRDRALPRPCPPKRSPRGALRRPWRRSRRSRSVRPPGRRGDLADGRDHRTRPPPGAQMRYRSRSMPARHASAKHGRGAARTGSPSRPRTTLFYRSDPRDGGIAHGLAVRMRTMIVHSFRHRGLRQLHETDSPRLLKQDLGGARARHPGRARPGRDHGGLRP